MDLGFKYSWLVWQLSNDRVSGVIRVYLHFLYKLILIRRPGLILEVGVGPLGVSTQAMAMAAEEAGSRMISIDSKGEAQIPPLSAWKLWKGTYQEFARDVLGNIQPFLGINFLFVDCGCRYDDTVKQIGFFFPYLSGEAIVLFHNTNLTVHMRFPDGFEHGGWDNGRGVVKAIQEYLGMTWDEDTE